MNRRQFLKRAAVLAATATTSTAKAFPSGVYVDVHTHLGQEWAPNGALSAKQLLKWMDSTDTAQAVVLPLISPESWFYPISTDFVLDRTKPHRDRLIPFCSIDPRTINLGSYEAKRDLLLRYKDAGARGFGEHKAGIPIDDPRNLELFKACAEVGFPVIFHLDNSRNTDKPGLPGLENVLKQIPDGIFIGHAQGWWASISGELTQSELQAYPAGKVTPGGAIDRLMDAYPNIYGDLSAGSGANAISRDREFGREFLIRRADRLLWGTDYLHKEQGIPQLELYPTLDLPADTAAKIYRDNARKLLGLT